MWAAKLVTKLGSEAGAAKLGSKAGFSVECSRFTFGILGVICLRIRLDIGLITNALPIPRYRSFLLSGFRRAPVGIASLREAISQRWTSHEAVSVYVYVSVYVSLSVYVSFHFLIVGCRYLLSFYVSVSFVDQCNLLWSLRCCSLWPHGCLARWRPPGRG
jgi:hypothetical protein